MRVLRYAQFGPPLDVLRLEDVPVPEPGAGQVRVRLTHRSINPSDLYQIAGMYAIRPRLPATPGNEAVGRVEALGEGVSGLAVGQRVIPIGVGGTWADAVLASPMQLVPVPDGVSDQTAAQFVVNPMTVWVMLTEELSLKPGDWLLQTAAGSTLGRLVIQLARLRGVKTINIVRRQEQTQELLDLGGDAAFSTQDPDIVSKVLELTGGKGAVAALEAVGGATGALALACLGQGGTMLVYGRLSGEPTPVDNGPLLFKGQTIHGFWLAQWLRDKPQAIPQVAGELMRLMAEGKLVPPVEAEYSLDDYRAAIEHATRPGNSGKILLVG